MTTRRINADVFRRARKAGAPLLLAAYVAQPPVLDLTWLDHYQSDETSADFTLDGRKFRAETTDPRVFEGTCIGCAELVDAYERRDEGMAWLTPEQYERMEHRAVRVVVLGEDDQETGHDAWLHGVCGLHDTEVDRLVDERYLAETVAELAGEAADRTDAADEARRTREDATRGITIDRETLEMWADRSLTGDEVERIEDALPHSSVPEAVATIAANLD